MIFISKFHIPKEVRSDYPQSALNIAGAKWCSDHDVKYEIVRGHHTKLAFGITFKSEEEYGMFMLRWL